MKVLFITNVPSPYRVDFFNELGKYCQLTVCFERKRASDRDEKWVGCGAQNFREIYADVQPIGADQSKGKGIVRVIRAEAFDRLIVSGYASPAVAKAIRYCRFHRIPYIVESDGGFFKKDTLLKGIYKKFLLKKAEKHFTTCEEYKKYLLSIGVKAERIEKYPFSSLREADILPRPLSEEEKRTLRRSLGMEEKRVVLSVGQFIPRKGFDLLLAAAGSLPDETGVYLIGGTPTEEYLRLVEEGGLSNVHFLPFMDKESLRKRYRAADCFAFPTREDIWGLVVNEAMANGLPVLTTERCIAGLELIEEEKNGYIVPVEDAGAIADRLKRLLDDGALRAQMAKNNLEKISGYTIESMAKWHAEHLCK